MLSQERDRPTSIACARLEEDAPWGDITSEMLIPPRPRPRAPISSRAKPGVFSGGEVFAAAFRLDRSRP